MRISIRQLKQIIKEQVEEAKKGGRRADIEIEETEVDLDRPPPGPARRHGPKQKRTRPKNI
jgi:hypothetical protein